MRQADRVIGSGLALLALAVLWTARTFPPMPGQKIGAGFLPTMVGAGLLVCALALVVRSFRAGVYAGGTAAPEGAPQQVTTALVIIGATLGYILLADLLGFLLVAPVCLLAAFIALRVRFVPALAWAIAGTLVVHVSFYKLLRVPLPWGVLRPLY